MRFSIFFLLMIIGVQCQASMVNRCPINPHILTILSAKNDDIVNSNHFFNQSDGYYVPYKNQQLSLKIEHRFKACTKRNRIDPHSIVQQLQEQEALLQQHYKDRERSHNSNLLFIANRLQVVVPAITGNTFNTCRIARLQSKINELESYLKVTDNFETTVFCEIIANISQLIRQGSQALLLGDLRDILYTLYNQQKDFNCAVLNKHSDLQKCEQQAKDLECVAQRQKMDNHTQWEKGLKDRIKKCNQELCIIRCLVGLVEESTEATYRMQGFVVQAHDIFWDIMEMDIFAENQDEALRLVQLVELFLHNFGHDASKVVTIDHLIIKKEQLARYASELKQSIDGSFCGFQEGNLLLDAMMLLSRIAQRMYECYKSNSSFYGIARDQQQKLDELNVSIQLMITSLKSDIEEPTKQLRIVSLEKAKKIKKAEEIEKQKSKLSQENAQLVEELVIQTPRSDVHKEKDSNQRISSTIRVVLSVATFFCASIIVSLCFSTFFYDNAYTA